MDEDSRTLWCGNLSENVTEDILYELFLQGGPVEKVSIPKDREGKRRTYGFVTFKHIKSVAYVIDLFDGTTLFNRPISMKIRNTVDKQSVVGQQQDQSQNINNLLQLGSQMVLGNLVPNLTMQMYGMCPAPGTVMYPSQQVNVHPYIDDRRSQRGHPYYRDRDSDREHDRDRINHYNQRNHRDRHSSSQRPNNYSRHDDRKSNRRNFR